MEVCERVFWRFRFVSTVGTSVSVCGLYVVGYCEDLVEIRCQEGEILKKPKKHDFWFDFRCFGFVSIGASSGDVGGCSQGGINVDLAASWGLEVKNAK
jgi:hypothetical protein